MTKPESKTALKWMDAASALTNNEADLQHTVSLPRLARLGDGGGDGGVDEEILPHGLAEMKAVAAQQRLDGGKVTMLHACLLCR